MGGCASDICQDCGGVLPSDAEKIELVAELLDMLHADGAWGQPDTLPAEVIGHLIRIAWRIRELDSKGLWNIQETAH